MTDNVDKLKELGKNEPIASFLDMNLTDLSDGYARVEMQMKPEYINFNGTIFGGIITAAADQAFAYATNSVTTPNVASQLNIHFIATAKENDKLVAECRVVKRGKRVCISEIKVTDPDGKLIALASGTTIPLG
ncbi:MAG: PaaI family thioesterase [Dehalococcoidia bacterium]|jgi:acyl-CoA thioesterase